MTPPSLKLLPPLILLGTANLVVAQDRPEEPDVNCALIKEGVQRLACYDAKYNPQAERNQASEEQLEEAEADAEELVADKKTREKIVGNALEDDPDDGGVMAALVDNYLSAERAIFSFTGSFVTHRPNYILPLPGWTPPPMPCPQARDWGGLLIMTTTWKTRKPNTRSASRFRC